MKIFLATTNKGKIKELRDMLPQEDWEVLSIDDFPDFPEIIEDGSSFVENALKKARVAVGRTGLLTLADDSGLEVDALDGAPGVHSARFAGEECDDEANNQKLLELLDGVPAEGRTARFRCVVAVAWPGGKVYTTEGVCEGVIATEPTGDGGFGYDPVFYVPGYKKTLAQLTLDEKNKVSHRGQAMSRALKIVFD